MTKLVEGLVDDGGVSEAVEELERDRDGLWVKHFFPDRFTRDFTEYQKDFWNWELGITEDEKSRPRIECEPRGVGKSSNARALVVKLLARRVKRYVLYICATDNQAQKHFNAIRSMLESPKLLRAYPHLRPQAQKYRPNVAKNWSSERLVTHDGQVVEFISLLSNARGFTTEEGKRPDMFVLDDIDDSKDSPHMVNKKLEILKYSILPARADNTLILFAQNLIHRDSICQQIRDQRADILSDRIFIGPFALMKWYDAVKEPIPDDQNGAQVWRIVSGDPEDEAIPLKVCEQLLNEYGRDAFERECQQDVFRINDDNDFREWNEQIHLITHSEFRAYWEQFNVPVWQHARNRLQIPPQWNVGLGMDWGTTVKHPSVVTAIARPNHNVPLSDCFFVFAEVVLPKYPLSSFEEVPLVSAGRVALALKDTLRQWNVADRQIKKQLMSHEASAALNTMAIDLQDDLKVFFAKWQAQKGSGVPQIQNLLEVDYTKQHPFRRHPTTGEPMMGCPRLFFIVSDEQGKLIADAYGKIFVAQAKDAEGFSRARYEMPIYSQFNSGQHKIDDDFVDSFRGIMNVFGVMAQPMSLEEEYVKTVEKEAPYEVLEERLSRAVDDEEAAHHATSQKLREQEIYSRLRKGREAVHAPWKKFG